MGNLSFLSPVDTEHTAKYEGPATPDHELGWPAWLSAHPPAAEKWQVFSDGTMVGSDPAGQGRTPAPDAKVQS